MLKKLKTLICKTELYEIQRLKKENESLLLRKNSFENQIEILNNQIEILNLDKKIMFLNHDSNLKRELSALEITFGDKMVETQVSYDNLIFEIIRNINQAKKLTVLYVTELEVRIGYDSTWGVIVVDEEGVHDIRLTRYSGESKTNLLKLLENCHSINEIKALDVKGKIYYD